MSLVSSSVSATASVASFPMTAKHVKNETIDDAISIGDLTEAGVVVTVTDDGTAAETAVSSAFTAKAGDIVTLSTSFDSTIDATATRYQLYDSDGNIIADNNGDTDQQYAYTQWVGSGLVLTDAGTYTAVATPQNGVASTITTQENQGTKISVNSKLTGSDTTEYYKFTLTAGNDIKMDFDAGSKNSSVRVQLLDSSGNVVADSEGNAYQKTKYISLTSGTGMTAETGDYTVAISYAKNADITEDISYNFQLYSGSTYSVVYDTKASAIAYDPSALGSVEATSDAESYSRTTYHKVNETAASAVSAGWIQEDKSAIKVLSQLTQFDNTQFYSFTLQEGDNIKFDFDSETTQDRTALRVQLYDSSGSRILADSEGTEAQKAAYAKLTSSDGLDIASGTSYVIKMTYAETANSKSDQPYLFYIMSGTSYSALYKTTSPAQTYANAVLNGNYGSTYSTASGLASYLTAQSNGEDSNIFSTLAMKV